MVQIEELDKKMPSKSAGLRSNREVMVLYTMVFAFVAGTRNNNSDHGFCATIGDCAIRHAVGKKRPGTRPGQVQQGGMLCHNPDTARGTLCGNNPAIMTT